MGNNLSKEDLMMQEAYRHSRAMDEREQKSKKRMELFKGNEDFEIVDKKLKKDNTGEFEFIIAKVRDSGVLFHIVFEEKSGEYRCAGITFPDDHYIHLDKEVVQE